jgi:hypothetical protein
MLDTIARYINQLRDVHNRNNLLPIINALGDRYSTQCLTSPGLAIKAALSVTVKAGSAFYYSVKGKLGTKAANTDMAALSGTVTNAKFNVFAFFVDDGGTLTSAMGTEGATLAAVVFPPIPENKACIGFVIINPTGTGNFVGGTTTLDDATVVPNAAYVNDVGPFDPTVLLR